MDLVLGKGILAYSPLASDTIFRIRDGRFSPAYYIDFGRKKCPQELSPEFRFALSERKRKYTGIIDNVVTNDMVLYFNFSRERISLDTYYFMHTGRIYTGALPDFKRNFIPIGHTLNYAEGYFRALADAYRMLMRTPEITKGLHLQEDDNPVIVLYRFRSK